MVTADRVLDVVLDHLRLLVAAQDDESVREEARQVLPRRRAQPNRKNQLVRTRERALARIVDIEAQLTLEKYPGSRAEAGALIERLRAEVALADQQLVEATRPEVPADVEGPRRAADLLARWDELEVDDRNSALRDLVKVFIRRRDPNAPWRQPYAERCVVRFSWE
jgi:hypothetical protein